MIQELDVQKIRKDFPMLQNQNLIYLDSSATSQKPYSVIRAVTDFYENCNANPLRGLYETAQNATEKYEAAREKVRQFIHAKSTEEIIFTRNATESLNLVAYSYGLMAFQPGDEIQVGSGTGNGFVSKVIRYLGKAAHAAGAPDKGVNALSAASLGLQALGLNRETFRDEDCVRVHPIITKGGNLVNVIPDEIVIETLVRAKTIEAFTDAAKKTDRSFQAGAVAMGAKIEITTLPGYLPTLAEQALPELKRAAELAAPEVPVREAAGHSGGSTDVGDVQHLMPVYTFNTGGVKGGLHQINFEVTNEEEAYIDTAKMFALAAYGLLKEKAARSKELVKNYKPVFKDSAEYTKFMEQFDSKEVLD